MEIFLGLVFFVLGMRRVLYIGCFVKWFLGGFREDGFGVGRVGEVGLRVESWIVWLGGYWYEFFCIVFFRKVFWWFLIRFYVELSFFFFSRIVVILLSLGIGM